MLHFTCQSSLARYQSVSRSWDIKNSPVRVCIRVWLYICVCVCVCVCKFVCLCLWERGSLSVDIKHPQLPLASSLWTAITAPDAEGVEECVCDVFVFVCVNVSMHPASTRSKLICPDLKLWLWSGLVQGQNQGPIWQTSLSWNKLIMPQITKTPTCFDF